MNNKSSVSWDEVYRIWKSCMYNGSQIVKKPIQVEELHVDKINDSLGVYGYGWLKNDEYVKVKQDIVNRCFSIFQLREPYKGTLHTLQMLVEAENDEERAAIWIYAFSKEVISTYPGKSLRFYASKLCNVAHSILYKKYRLWHHAMRRLIPEVYMGYGILDKTEFDSIDAVVELAYLNAVITLHEYVPVLLTSRPEGERKPDESVRLREFTR